MSGRLPPCQDWHRGLPWPTRRGRGLSVPTARASSCYPAKRTYNPPSRRVSQIVSPFFPRDLQAALRAVGPVPYYGHGGRRDLCGSLFPADDPALDDYLERTTWLNWTTDWRTWPTAGPRILPLAICSSVLRCR